MIKYAAKEWSFYTNQGNFKTDACMTGSLDSMT